MICVTKPKDLSNRKLNLQRMTHPQTNSLITEPPQSFCSMYKFILSPKAATYHLNYYFYIDYTHLWATGKQATFSQPMTQLRQYPQCPPHLKPTITPSNSSPNSHPLKTSQAPHPKHPHTQEHHNPQNKQTHNPPS